MKKRENKFLSAALRVRVEVCAFKQSTAAVNFIWLLFVAPNKQKPTPSHLHGAKKRRNVWQKNTRSKQIEENITSTVNANDDEEAAR